MKPFFVLSKSLGFFPYSFGNKFYNCGIMKVTKWDILLTLPPVCCMCIVFTTIIAHYLQYSNLHGIFDYKIWIWLIFACVLNLFVHFAFQIVRRDKMEKFLCILKTCDLQFNALKIKINHREHRKVVVCITILVVLLVGLFFGAIVFTSLVLREFDHNVVAMELFYFYYLLYETFFCVQFFIPTFHLCNRIMLLKKHIESSGKNLKLKLVAELFHDLCDAILMINSIFTPHLIITMTLMMISDILVVYQIFFYLLQYQDPTSAFFVFENGFFVIFHFMLKCGISHIGHKTMTEAELIKTAVVRSFDVECSDKKFEYLQVLAQFNTRNLKLQNAFFIIDWRLVLGVCQHAYLNSINYNLFIADIINYHHIFGHNVRLDNASNSISFILFFSCQFQSPLTNY